MPRAHSPLTPTPPPKHVFDFRPRLSSLYLTPSVTHSLQNRDVEKDVNLKVSQEVSSKPGSDRSLDLDLSAKLQNPLAGRDKATLEAEAISFCERHGLMEYGACNHCVNLYVTPDCYFFLSPFQSKITSEAPS